MRNGLIDSHRNKTFGFQKGTGYWTGKKRPPMTKEWKDKISESHKGDKHPLWIKDRSKLSTDRRNDPKYRQWLIDVKIRDNFKCKINNKECKGRIESHHIRAWRDYPKLRYEVSNGITLCSFHHPRKRVEANKNISFFNSLIK